jgi:hypothetical protein
VIKAKLVEMEFEDTFVFHTDAPSLDPESGDLHLQTSTEAKAIAAARPPLVSEISSLRYEAYV